MSRATKRRNKKCETGTTRHTNFSKNFLIPPPHDDITIKQKAFHITIVDNSNGNVIADTDTNCIVGAFDESNGTRQVGLSKCNIVELTATCAVAREFIDKMTEDNPLAKLLLKIGD